MPRRLTRNAARCNGCDEVVESTHRHDMRTCSCGATSVDGGLAYVRRLFSGDGPGYTDLNEHEVVACPRCGEVEDVKFCDCLDLTGSVA